MLTAVGKPLGTKVPLDRRRGGWSLQRKAEIVRPSFCVDALVFWGLGVEGWDLKGQGGVRGMYNGQYFPHYSTGGKYSPVLHTTLKFALKYTNSVVDSMEICPDHPHLNDISMKG